ncbi:MAG: hypothetical protein K2X93_02300 [Candidatus Obscuribacterales bacterium]|nr:hypothetical protein [Candidatus Obscuribacterales bacterium]
MTIKAAYARQTIDHQAIASAFCFVALALLPIAWKLDKSRLARTICGIILAISLFVALPINLRYNSQTNYFLYPSLILYNFIQLNARVEALINCVNGSSTFKNEYAKRMSKVKNDNELPEIKGSVDIYPCLCNVVLAHGYNYKPRPIFQSYLAYRKSLADLNATHLKTGKAADYLILQELKDLYGYYPMLYDGPSWPEILSRYQPIELHKGGLLVKKRATPLSYELKSLRRVPLKLGEKIDLSKDTGKKIVFAKINLPLTPFGSLQKLFWRIYPPTLTVHLKDGSKQSFCAPSEIMKSGFIISPFVEKTEEIQSLFTKSDALNPLEVQAFSIVEEKKDLPLPVFQDGTVELFQIDSNNLENVE